MRLPIILLTILLAAAACSSSQQTTTENRTSEDLRETESTTGENQKNQAADLTGKWNWIRTDCCGRMKKTYWASQADSNVAVEFMENGRYILTVNGKEQKVNSYTISKGDIYPNGLSLKIGNGRPAIIQWHHDTLVLNYEYMDLQLEYYVKER